MTGGVIRQQKNAILKNVNIEIQNGEFVYLIGKVGSGKSSFLKTLYAELPFEYGNAEVAGYQLKKIRKSQIPLLRRKCGIVFQDFKLLIDRNVYENLAFVLRATGWKNKKAIKERIETVLTKVGMLDKQSQMPHQLSGGEQQRIVLARALLNAPPLILADEPTGNIDPETSYRLIELLKEICDTGKTIIIATHQYDLIEKYPGRVFCCENGELYEKTSLTPCACTDTAAELPKVEEIIPTAPTPDPIENRPQADNLAIEEKIIQEELKVLTEIQTDDIPFKQIEVLETTLVREEESIPPETPSGKVPENQEDIMSLIGKLDYPEISAFDYELEQLPEIKSKDKEEATPEQIPVTESSKEEVLALPELQSDIKQDNKKNTPPPMDLELID